EIEDLEIECRRMTRIVQDLLDVARFESGALPVVAAEGDLAESVRSAVARQPNSERIRLDLADGAFSTRFDADRVDQILDNLLSNALRHTAPGTEVEVRLRRDGHTLVVRVVDHG